MSSTTKSVPPSDPPSGGTVSRQCTTYTNPGETNGKGSLPALGLKMLYTRTLNLPSYPIHSTKLKGPILDGNSKHIDAVRSPSRIENIMSLSLSPYSVFSPRCSVSNSRNIHSPHLPSPRLPSRIKGQLPFRSAPTTPSSSSSTHLPPLPLTSPHTQSHAHNPKPTKMPQLLPIPGTDFFLWKYRPSLPLAITSIVLFTILTIAHGYRTYRTKAWFCIWFGLG